MANTLYPSVKEKFLDGGVIMTTNDIRVICVDGAGYTFNSSHSTLADIPSIERVAVSGALTGKDASFGGIPGIFGAANLAIPFVTGDEFEILVMYKHTALETAPLIAYIDVFTLGAPFTPNGGSVDIIWHEDGIFQL